MKAKAVTKSSLLEELNEMLWRINKWEKPYPDHPGEWTREASRTAYPIIARIAKRLEQL